MSQLSPDLSIARWRKYGNDRLYVALADGTKVGYWDLVADEAHPETSDLGALLDGAYDAWLHSRDVVVPTAPPF
jgi:hypothetical protein